MTNNSQSENSMKKNKKMPFTKYWITRIVCTFCFFVFICLFVFIRLYIGELYSRIELLERQFEIEHSIHELSVYFAKNDKMPTNIDALETINNQNIEDWAFFVTDENSVYFSLSGSNHNTLFCIVAYQKKTSMLEITWKMNGKVFCQTLHPCHIQK
jgi:hypothetical protein